MIPLRDDNPTTITPVVTIALIATNILVFIYQASLPPRSAEVFVYKFAAIPSVIFGTRDLPEALVAIPAQLTLLTSMFLHGGFMHLAGNMLYLWIFGNNIEEAMGHVRAVIFYLLCGLLASLAHVFSNPSSTIPSRFWARSCSRNCFEPLALERSPTSSTELSCSSGTAP